jgi:hypothetical protein
MAATTPNPFQSSSKKFNVGDIYSAGNIFDFGIPALGTAGTYSFPTTGTTAVPPLAGTQKQIIDYLQAAYPYERQRMVDAAQIQSALTQQELAATYPWLSQAASEATARNLAASQAYRSFAEGLPSNVQNIMASKQAQMASAASSEAERARAMAAQSDAAKRFAGSYAGKYVSYS